MASAAAGQDHMSPNEVRLPFHPILPTEIRLMIYEYAFETKPHPDTEVDLVHATPPSYGLLATCRYIYFDARETYQRLYQAYWREVKFTFEWDYLTPSTRQAACAAVLRSPREVNSIQKLTYTLRMGPIVRYDTVIDTRGLMLLRWYAHGVVLHPGRFIVLEPTWGPRLTRVTRSTLRQRCGPGRFGKKWFVNPTTASGYLARLSHTALLDDQLLWLLRAGFPKSRVFEAA